MKRCTTVKRNIPFFREFSKEREKAASRGEYHKNKARNQMDEDMKVSNYKETNFLNTW